VDAFVGDTSMRLQDIGGAWPQLMAGTCYPQKRRPGNTASSAGFSTFLAA